MQILSQNQMQDVQRNPVAIPASEHPEVVIPQGLEGAVGKGPDANELKFEKDVANTVLPKTVAVPENIAVSAGGINLPMTYEEALKKKNSTHFWDSMHWLAASIMYQWMKYDPDVVRAVKKK